MEKEIVLQEIEKTGLIAVIRGIEPEKVEKVARALLKGGVKVLEITLNSPEPLKMIESLKEKLQEEDAIIGAGTVLDSESARSAIFAGADFVFCPNLHLKTIELCRRYSKLVIPGVMTPTEILTAIEAGADALKIFPASTVGPQFIKSVKGPLGNLKLIPTGGISLDNAEDYLKAGAFALGAGGELLDKEAIKNGKYQKITDIARSFRRIIEKARTSN